MSYGEDVLEGKDLGDSRTHEATAADLHRDHCGNQQQQSDSDRTHGRPKASAAHPNPAMPTIADAMLPTLKVVNTRPSSALG